MNKINITRILERLERLALCTESSNGVTRRSFTEQSEQAEKLVIQWMQEAGMAVRKDAMNNVIGRFEGKDPNMPVLMMGSHIDTVINGGKYDGTLGVISAIEVIHVLHESKQIPEHPLEVVCFCDEEGTRFHTTFLGSRAMVGALTADDLTKCDDHGISVAQAMMENGLIPECYQYAKRQAGSILAYLELHIEQGPVLEYIKQPCGSVSGIAGVSRYTFTIKGKAGHAGTVPMKKRQDALSGAAEILVKIEEMAKQYSPLVATVGKLVVGPGTSNVIPGIVKGTLDVRDTEVKRKSEYLTKLFADVNKMVKRRNLTCQFEKILEIAPVSCSRKIIDCIDTAMLINGINPHQLMSGAGHDAMIMAELTNVGMIFVRCREGISHHPNEFVTPADIEISAKILLDAVWMIANDVSVNEVERE
ncbi:Zn-dependent hydrolase [Bacillus marasmi]|uniref:Zn-dependent hydrolase n=1 Tax=Bacillus marasmi TaxID=1926279 RepID=UPI001FE75AF4|nr:Zn-dependent hydrolase [Bacillus marasmi]